MHQNSDEYRFNILMKEKKKKNNQIILTQPPFKHEIMTLRISASYKCLIR